MLANKYVDNSTYTSTTWSEISRIPLDHIDKAEEEFLNGIGDNLCVNLPTFDAWLNTLKTPKTLEIEMEVEEAEYLRKRSVLLPRSVQPGRLVRARSSSLQPGVAGTNSPTTSQSHAEQRMRMLYLTRSILRPNLSFQFRS